MADRRLFVTKDLNTGAIIQLDQAQAHYLLHVLRLQEGAQLLAFNGKHGEWRVRIAKAGKTGCSIEPIEKVREQTVAQDLHYAFAPLKQGRLDYMVQKAVEMGVSVLQPVFTAHTAVPRINLERVRSNVIEAAEQCGVLSIPEVNAPLNLETLLQACENERVIVFCDERAAVASPLAVLSRLSGQKVTALLGPEGGFSADERKMLLSRKLVCPVSLGPRVMRADTAAVAILALINAVLGDWR